MHRSIIKMSCALFLFPSTLFCPAQSAVPSKQIDTTKSLIRIHVYKAGMFSAFGHEHDIRAPIAEGLVNEEQATVTLRVHSGELRVLDKDVSDSDRAKIQQTMLGAQVLDTVRFPEIKFSSTRIEADGTGRWIVEGDLTLHGQTRPVKFAVQGSEGRYQGDVELKQKNFGITPVTVAGGTIKVKNEVRLEFDVYVH